MGGGGGGSAVLPALKAVTLDATSLNCKQFEVSLDHLQFKTDSVVVTLFGIKNNSDHSGFVVDIPRGDNLSLDPVHALEVYVKRTAQLRPKDDRTVFLTLTSPYSVISSQSVANILNDCIKAAGLGGLGYSAKYFRPAAASASLDFGLIPESAMIIDHWKIKEVCFIYELQIIILLEC